jgi:hypothetical protein
VEAAVRSLSDGERAILAQDGDDDDTRCAGTTFVRLRTARKQHCCDTCAWGAILPGESYTELVIIYFSEISIERHCRIPGCKRADEILDLMHEDQRRQSCGSV